MIKTTSIILIFTAVVAWLVYLYPLEAISPGDLLEEHRQLEENCSNCHETFSGPSGAKCVNCHAIDKIGVNNTLKQGSVLNTKKSSFHANLTEESCISCHKEHQGSFAVKQTIQFSHEMLGIETGSNCVNCHQPPNDSIHQQPGLNCVECHKTSNWTSSEIDHTAYFQFDRDHPAECSTCHPEASYKVYTCYGCHEHTSQKIARKHNKEGIRDYENCAECHPSGNEHDIRKSRSIKNRQSESKDEKKSKSAKKRSNKHRDHSDEEDYEDEDH